MANALTNYAQQKYNDYSTLKQSALGDFSTASAQLKVAKSSYESLVSQVATLDNAIASKRLAMSEVNNMPSDIETLAEQLRQLLIDRRHQNGELAIAAQTVRFSELSVSLFETQIAQITQTLTEVNNELTAATQRQQHHDLWLATETEDAIDDVRDLATDLLAGNPITVAEGEENPADAYNAATARIENDFPALLLVRARARAALLNNRLASYQSYQNSINDDVLDHGAATEGSVGLVAQRTLQYEATELNLKSYALSSVGLYQHALSQLKSVVSSGTLTSAESARITSLELAADSDEITTENTLHEAREAVIAKRLDVQLAIIAAQQNDVNADPNSDSAVQTAQSELVALEADLVAAEVAHTTEFATSIDLWESAIPDALWANLHNYDAAQQTLTLLSNSDGSVLASAFTNAESALVVALTADDNSKKLDNVLTAAGKVAGSKNEYLQSNQQSLLLSAMRGDY